MKIYIQSVSVYHLNILHIIHYLLESEENEVERTDDKAKSSTNEDIRLRLGSIEQSHGQNHQQHYRLNHVSSHKNYKGTLFLL
jgi:hypothetical protein